VLTGGGEPEQIAAEKERGLAGAAGVESNGTPVSIVVNPYVAPAV
jgi:hypothetical protein